MTVVIRGNVASGVTFSSSPRSVTKDAAVVSGDLLLLVVHLGNAIAPAAITPPSGFTLVSGSEITNTPSIAVYQKVAGGSEPSSYTVSWTGGGNGILTLLALYSDTATPLVLDGVAAQLNASGDRLWASVTTTLPNAFLACFAVVTSNVATTPHAGMTERLDNASASRNYLMTQTLGAAGATGTRTGTGTASTSATVTLAIAEQILTGAAAITLDAVTLAATGNVPVVGSAAISLDAVSLSATGAVPVVGAAAITLANLTLGAAGLLVPLAPTAFTATALDEVSIELEWEHGGANLDGFSIERSADGVGGWAVIATVDDADRSYTDEGLQSGISYYYRIRAYRSE